MLTIREGRIYIAPMRWQAVIVLIAAVFSIVAPPTLPLIAAKGGESVIGTLNICHSATPSLSSNGQMPCVNVSPRRQVPSPSIAYIINMNILFTPLLSPRQHEHPPKA